MKEASGEANLTVVAIILIGVIAAVVTPLINNLMKNTKARTECLNNGQCWTNNQCGECTE
jgi:putative effector of murein hydrolase